MYQLDEARTYVRAAHEQPSMPITPTTPLDDVFAAMQQHRSGDMGEHDISRVDPLAEHGAPRASARPRAARRSSAETSKLSAAAVKNKRRGMSAAALAELTAAAEREVRGAEAGLWTLPLGGALPLPLALHSSSPRASPAHPRCSARRGSRLVNGASRGRAPHLLRPAVDRQHEPLLGDRVRLLFLMEPSSPSSASLTLSPFARSSSTCASSYRTPRPRVPIGPDVPTVTSVDGPLTTATRDGEPGMLSASHSSLHCVKVLRCVDQS